MPCFATLRCPGQVVCSQLLVASQGASARRHDLTLRGEGSTLRLARQRSPQEQLHGTGSCHRQQRAASSTRAARSPATAATTVNRTKEIFERVDRRNSTPDRQAGGAGGRTTFAAFQAADEAWRKLRHMAEGAAAGPAPRFVTTSPSALPTSPEYDVVVCGGTLGIFAAVALQRSGLRVAVLERGTLRGRDQEWNISRKELHELAEVGIATKEELDACVNKEFNPVRARFYPDVEVWTRDVLNLGVSPAKLIAKMRSLFEEVGGVVLESTGLQGISVHPNGCRLNIQSSKSNGGGSGSGGTAPAPPSQLSARLVVDCMGHSSPIVKQIRWGHKPDGVCIVVGTLAGGFTNNTTGDVILTNTPLQPPGTETSCLQYFWEAFPAGSGPSDRTTYMFTYLDAQPWRPSMAAVFEDYWDLMPQYQGVQLADLDIKRILFGSFPTFRSSPLKPAFDRVLQIGDASGIQSPLSFGGFGALTRHLKRVVTGTCEALAADVLDKHSLGLIHPYNPALSSAWMLQRAMSVPHRERPPPPNLINNLLGNNFKALQSLGEPAMKPFLQDVLQPGPLLQTLVKQMLIDPLGIPPLLLHVGAIPLVDWARHLAAMVTFSALHAVAAPPLRVAAEKLPAPRRYALRRTLEAWEYGSGRDYKP